MTRTYEPFPDGDLTPSDIARMKREARAKERTFRQYDEAEQAAQRDAEELAAYREAATRKDPAPKHTPPDTSHMVTDAQLTTAARQRRQEDLWRYLRKRYPRRTRRMLKDLAWHQRQAWLRGIEVDGTKRA